MIEIDFQPRKKYVMQIGSKTITSTLIGGTKRGTLWYNGDGDPDPALGRNGDYYLDNISKDYYAKENGNWVFKGSLSDAPVGLTADDITYSDTGFYLGGGSVQSGLVLLDTKLDSHDSLIAARLRRDLNLSDLSDAAAARTSLGIGNINNTSDANKPVSTAQASAIAGKEPVINATSVADYFRGDKTFQPLNKAAVGLGNVDNTSDTNKPVSTAQQTAIDAKVIDSIADSDTTHAPSRNAVFDALAGKSNVGHGHAGTEISYSGGGNIDAKIANVVSLLADTLSAPLNLDDLPDKSIARNNLGLAAGATAANTDGLTEGATNKYFTDARSVAALLTGFSVAGAKVDIVATDTVRAAFGKVQKYLNDLSALAFSGAWADIQNIPVTHLAPNAGIDFINHFVSSTVISGLETTLVSGGAISLGTPDINHPGVLDFSTFTSAAGLSGVRFGGNNSIASSGGALFFEMACKLPVLGTAGENYTVRGGFGNTIIISTESTNGAFFRYNYNVNGGRWQCVTRNNNTETSTDSTVTVVAATWYKMRVAFNAAGTSVVFTINGTVVATVSTNVPTGVTRLFGVFLGINKSAGTTARIMTADYYWVNQQFTTPT